MPGSELTGVAAGAPSEGDVTEEDGVMGVVTREAAMRVAGK